MKEKGGSGKGRRGCWRKQGVLWEMHKWRITEVRALTLEFVSRAVRKGFFALGSSKPLNFFLE